MRKSVPSALARRLVLQHNYAFDLCILDELTAPRKYAVIYAYPYYRLAKSLNEIDGLYRDCISLIIA